MQGQPILAAAPMSTAAETEGTAQNAEGAAAAAAAVEGGAGAPVAGTGEGVVNAANVAAGDGAGGGGSGDAGAAQQQRRGVTAQRPVRPEWLVPQRVNGRWRKPRLSLRKQAVARKAAILEGTYGSWDEATGLGWDPAWDRHKKVTVMRKPKGRRHDREQASRMAKIDEGLAAQEKLVAAYRREEKARKPKKGLLQFLKREKWEKDD